MTSHIDTLADALASSGVRHAFGVLGSGSSYALMSALGERGVVYQPTGHEAAAGMMAGAACRFGTTAAAALTIKGPGFANLFPAIVSNAYECRPAVTVSEAYPPGAPLSAQHKRLDHPAALTGVAKALAYAGGDDRSVRDALRVAVAEVPGPVHVELCAMPVEQPLDELGTSHSSGAASSQMESILARIAAAKRPALLLGSAVVRRAPDVDWAAPGVPVATTAAAKGALDETLPTAAGVATGETGALSPETAVLAHADLIIGVGLRNVEMVRSAPLPAPLVIVDCVAGDVHEGFAAEEVVQVGDLTAAAARILDALASAPRWGEDLVAVRRAEIARRLSAGWLPSHVFRSCSVHAPEAVMVLDTGLFCIVGEAAWPARRPDLFCGSSNGRFMGTGIPTGIGIAAAESRPVIVAAGDGGSRPYAAELRIAATAGLPLLVIVMNDGGFGTIASADPAARIGHAALGTGDVTWSALAGALGLEAVRAADEAAADAAIASWAARPRPMLVEAMFDSKAYVSMVEGLR